MAKLGTLRSVRSVQDPLHPLAFVDVTFFELQVANKPGILGEIAGFLHKAHINIEAFNAGRDGLRILANDPDATRKVLAAHGVGYVEEEVIEIRLENKPGQLAQVASALGRHGVNIITSFGAAGGADGGSIYVGVDDVEAAWEALEEVKGE